MQVLNIPSVVRTLPAGRLVTSAVETDAVLYLREDDWGLKKYPRHCPAEIRMGSWDIDGVLAIVVLLRLARSDATTFEHWLDPAEAKAVRTLQCLASQSQVDIHVVADSETRTIRVANPITIPASLLVNRLRTRPAWPPEDFQRACARLSKLYPTPSTLWRNCE